MMRPSGNTMICVPGRTNLDKEDTSGPESAAASGKVMLVKGLLAWTNFPATYESVSEDRVVPIIP
jgi:hypothetical protein